jgi:hypothetical protein
MRAMTLTVAGVLAITACVSVRPHARATTRGGGDVLAGAGAHDPATAADIGARGLPTDRPGAGMPSPVAEADTRRVCRAGPRPSGWIAVAYVADDASCAVRPATDSAYAVAVLAHYALLPASAVLEVCADERIPENWALDTAAPAEQSDACPGQKGNPSSTTRRIKRVR